jgi:carboxymethylenebutenolidase
MTGGIGRKALTNFYRDHFIFNNPNDTQLELVSRTVGVDRVIDEFIFCFTHDKVIDWLFVSSPFPLPFHLFPT